MPKTLFNALAIRHPEIMLTISRMIALRSRKITKSIYSGSNNVNLRTVALLPVSNEVPILEFAARLHEALNTMGERTGLIQTRNIMAHLGRHAFTRLGRLKLMGWLHDLEETHRIILYVADGGVTAPWTQRCIRQVKNSLIPRRTVCS
jgi:lysophospholipid hydrolase